MIRCVAEKEGLKSDALAQTVAQLSHLFTKERSGLTQTYLEDPVLAAAYLQYFMPVNLAKVSVLLDEMPVPDVAGRFSVLDVGAGPGTGALAVLDWWQRQTLKGELAVTAVDKSSMALRQAQRLWKMVCEAEGIVTARVDVVEGGIERTACAGKIMTQAPYDVIILANSLNEIAADLSDPFAVRSKVLSSLLDALSPHGTLMIVEPALRETSRALYQIRDQLLQEDRCTVYSPCLHENGCPALLNPYNWCHEERAWEPPALIQEIDTQVGFIKDALKFSYLLLRKDGKRIVNRQPDVHRVVSELRVMKGEKRAWLCNELGRQEVGRQDRLASPDNAVFDQWRRGDIVQIEKVSHKERRGKVSGLGRIEQDVAVKIVRPA